ncbi:DUF4386 domain-containing protein [Lysobacter sp. CA196]|uniref:DUF4386 domain-containing protein n=1 Tax=Lysobacter sp. CA196 TaxID=3455606 RepID=UPI003F8D2075
MGRTEGKGMNKRLARAAGALYLVVVLSGIFSLAYVPSQLFVRGDASSTVGNIVAALPLFRFGIAAGLVCYTAFLLLPFVLYRLLSPVHRNAAVLMVVLAVVSVPISFVNLFHKLDVLSLLSGADHLRAFTTEQLQAQVMLSLAGYSNGILVCKLLWGLWLLPFGYLVFKSGFLPKILGILLMMGCFGYSIDVFARLLIPGFTETAFAGVVSLPASLGEIGTCLWLLIMGARDSNHPAASGHPAV